MSDTQAGPQVSTDIVCRIIMRAREFDTQEPPVIEDDASNPSDDHFREILEANKDDPTFEELITFIGDLNIDDQCDVVALAWVGRGDYDASEWSEARRLARQQHNGRTAAYLLGIPLLADYLEEGLAAFDMSCTDFERDHL